MTVDIQALNERIAEASSFSDLLLNEVGKVLVGQRPMLERMLIGLLCRGHILLEGVPGLAKTTAIKALSEALDTDFQRIQFTPDLLPADLLGTMVYNPKDGTFETKRGPIFTNLVLADEINRAPAKVQSALLEAMQERQVTLGNESYSLADPFLVLATQNPIEQEGTYPLPEAQVDRFMLKVRVGYPTMEEESIIVDRMATGAPPEVKTIVSAEKLIATSNLVDEIYVDPRVKEYILKIVFATREPSEYGLSELRGLIQYGASPRASIFLTAAARAHAFLRHRGYVTPDDVKLIGPDILRHRILLTYEAEAEEMTSEDIIQRIFDAVEVP